MTFLFLFSGSFGTLTPATLDTVTEGVAADGDMLLHRQDIY